MAYEQKPNTFNLFKDNEERLQKRRDFYKSKDWDVSGIPTYSGKLLLEDGTEVMLEARLIDGKNGKFFGGRAWKAKPKDEGFGGNRQQPQTKASYEEELSDDIPF